MPCHEGWAWLQTGILTCSLLPAVQLTIAVAEGRRPEVPPPSQLPGGGGSFEGLGPYIALMRACWSQDPAARPDFGQIVTALEWVPRNLTLF